VMFLFLITLDSRAITAINVMHSQGMFLEVCATSIFHPFSILRVSPFLLLLYVCLFVGRPLCCVFRSGQVDGGDDENDGSSDDFKDVDDDDDDVGEEEDDDDDGTGSKTAPVQQGGHVDVDDQVDALEQHDPDELNSEDDDEEVQKSLEVTDKKDIEDTIYCLYTRVFRVYPFPCCYSQDL